MSNCKGCDTPSTPTPYYEEASKEVTQDHGSIFRDTQYAAGVVVGQEFQIPAVDTDIQVCVENVVNVVIGSYLWHPRYGYLKIVYWDSCTGKIGLLNEGLDGIAAPGSVVPECTAFVVSPRSCCADEDNFALFPFLAEDFVVPGVGNSVTLQVTSTFGLVVGTVIRIGTCLYYLESINSSLEIVVTNQGAGCTPGSTIEARDVNGDLQYLITTQVVTSCSASKTDTGRLIICDGAEEHILDGEFVGQVPVLQNPSSDEVKFELLDTSVRVCTVLTADFNIFSTTPSYIILVDDKSLFEIGDILQINFDFTNLRWEVTDNTIAGQLSITCTIGNPGLTTVLLTGSAVCKQLLADDVEIIEEFLIANPFVDWVDISTLAAVYASPNSIFISGGASSPFYAALLPGTRIKYVDSSLNTKYAYVAFRTIVGADLTVTFAVTTDYTVIVGAITALYYSYVSPLGFPIYFTYTPVLAGVASTVGAIGRYSVDGQNHAIVNFYAEGVSNATSFYVSVPFDCLVAITGQPIGVLSNVKDNNVAVNGLGAALGYPSVVTLQTRLSLNGNGINNWTNVLNKAGYGLLNYLINQGV